MSFEKEMAPYKNDTFFYSNIYTFKRKKFTTARQMTYENTLPEMDNYGNHKEWCIRKMAQLVKKCPKVIFKKTFLNLLFDLDQTRGHGILKSSLFPLQNDMTITLVCLIVGGKFYLIMYIGCEISFL